MGCRPIIYSDKNFWNEYLKETFSHYTVWISDYSNERSDVASINWAFWQFTDQGKTEGVSGFVDQSRFKGNEKHYSHWETARYDQPDSYPDRKQGFSVV